MNDSSKVLKVVFIILLIVTAGELFYFFVYQPSVFNKKTANMSPTTVMKNNTISPDNNLAVSRDQINYLSSLKKIDVDQWKILMNQEVEGYVSQLKPIDEKSISFILLDKDNKKIEEFRKYPLVKDVPLKVYIVINSITSPADLKDIKNGDKIKVSTTFDLSKALLKAGVSNELYIYR